MTDLIKSYIVIDKDFKNYDLLKKYFKLIVKKDIEIKEVNESILEVEDLLFDDFITLKVSILTIKNDLNLEKLFLIYSPLSLKDYEDILLDVDQNSFDIYDALLALKNESLKLEFINSILNNVDLHILNTVKTYLEMNSSINNASKALFLHRNTVLYQINKFINLTKINIKNNNNVALLRYMINIYLKERSNDETL